MGGQALLIGINEYKRAPLRGCVNDALEMKAVLEGLYGFSSSNITLLLNQDALSENIILEIEKMVDSASPGDSLVFFFAGHGTQVGLNIDGELDGKDEAIVPYDMDYRSLIRDNVIYEKLVSPLTEAGDIHATAIFDCCHSGTILRDIVYDEKTGLAEIPVMNRCLPPWFLENTVALRVRELTFLPINGYTACKDNETAADLLRVGPRGLPRGAFSYAFHHLLRQFPDITSSQLESLIPEEIKKVSPSHQQTPQLYSPDPDAPVIVGVPRQAA